MEVRVVSTEIPDDAAILVRRTACGRIIGSVTRERNRLKSLIEVMVESHDRHNGAGRRRHGIEIVGDVHNTVPRPAGTDDYVRDEHLRRDGLPGDDGHGERIGLGDAIIREGRLKLEMKIFILNMSGRDDAGGVDGHEFIRRLEAPRRIDVLLDAVGISCGADERTA